MSQNDAEEKEFFVKEKKQIWRRFQGLEELWAYGADAAEAEVIVMVLNKNRRLTLLMRAANWDWSDLEYALGVRRNQK